MKGLTTCFMPNLRMPGENYSFFNCHSSRTAPGISFFRMPTQNDNKIKVEEQHCCSYYLCIAGDLKRQIKNRTLHHSRYISNIESANKKKPIINVAFLSGITLVSDMVGKERAIKLLPCCIKKFYIFTEL